MSCAPQGAGAASDSPYGDEAPTLAMQTQGATLPVTFKFGTSIEPVYRTFAAMSDLAAFCAAMTAHIQGVLARAWSAKDAIDHASFITA